MLRLRLSLLAMAALTALPALAQIFPNASPIPNGVAPVIPVTPQVGVSPPLNTGAPVGAIGTGGTTTQIMPNYPSPTGGVSQPGSTTYSGISSYGQPSSTTSATSSSLPGYTQPGSTSLPGYSAPPGTVAFPGMNPSVSPGLPTSPSMSGSSGLGTGASGGGLNTRP